MKLVLFSILLTSLVFFSASSVLAQSTTDAAERADNLRLQLLDVQDKEAALQERVRQLEEDIKPENIERSLAGVGSTRPEELRELRRRQLQIEKDGLIAQLGILAKSKASLESTLAQAEAEAYQQSAKGASAATLDQLFLAQVSGLPTWVMILILTVVPALGIIGVVIVMRRLQRSRLPPAV